MLSHRAAPLFWGGSISGVRAAHASSGNGIDGSSIPGHPSRCWRAVATGKWGPHSDLQRPAYGQHPEQGRHSACRRRGAPFMVEYERRRRRLRRDERPWRGGPGQVVRCRETGVDLICRNRRRPPGRAVGAGAGRVRGGACGRVGGVGVSDAGLVQCEDCLRGGSAPTPRSDVASRHGLGRTTCWWHSRKRMSVGPQDEPFHRPLGHSRPPVPTLAYPERRGSFLWSPLAFRGNGVRCCIHGRSWWPGCRAPPALARGRAAGGEEALGGRAPG